MIDKIYEHLKTKKKYNTLELKYRVKCDELDRKIVELNTEKRIKLKQFEIFEKELKDLTEKNFEQKREMTMLRKEIRELRKEKRDAKENTKGTTRGRQKSK